MKVLTVVGARPQFVKAAAISREIAKYPDIHEVIVHTGQHFDANMSRVFFEELEIALPHYHLNVKSLSHGAMTGRMIEKIEEILLMEKPDFVIVYGDTNSTLAGALAAKKQHVRVVHVEAGLRSFNMQMPEEINRILTDRISDILYCPTDRAVENLRQEGFSRFFCKVIRTGDVMMDAAFYYEKISCRKSRIIDKLKLKDEEFLLCTIHREENTNNINRLISIVNALNKLSKGAKVVVPLHPRTARILRGNVVRIDFTAIEPVSYFDMIELLKHARLVLTDSGGLQKEAYFFCKPCVTLREETEWEELISAGCNVLAGTDADEIVASVARLLSASLVFAGDLYGKGNASETIVQSLRDSVNG